MLVSVIAQNAANADAVVLNKALVAANYSLELFCDAVSIAKSNDGNDTIYSLFRSGLDLDAFKKIMEVEVAKNPDANFWELCESLRRSSDATNNPNVKVFPGAVFNKIGSLNATVNVSVHAVMSGIVCTDDRAATVVPGSGKQVAAGAGSAITFCNENDMFISGAQSLPNTQRCVSHYSHTKSMNSTEGAGSGKTYVKDALHTFTVAGLRSLTSLGQFYRFKQQQTNVTESELNTYFGWDKDGAVMPVTENTTDSSALQFVVRSNAGDMTTQANTGVVGNGIYVSVFTGTNAALAATYQTADGAANKTKAQSATSYSSADFYSGFPDARDILQALHKSWTSKQIVACGFEYNDIKNAGFAIELSDFVEDKTPSNFITSVLGYVDTSGVISYNGVTVKYTEVLSKLKEAGYSLADLKNDATTKTMLQTFDTANVGGSGWAAAMSVYADQVSLKDRLTQFDSYTGLGAMVGASTFTNAAGYVDNSERYFRPLKEVFGAFTKASQFIDALVELDGEGLSLTLPTVGTATGNLQTGGYFPSSYSKRQKIEAAFTLLHGNATSSTESVFKNYLLALAQHADMEGVAKIRQQFCFWDEPANYNVNNAGDMKFRSAIDTYVSSDLPTASYYALYGVGQQQYIQEAAGASHSISGKPWGQYYQSENGNGPHKLYAAALKVGGVSPAAAIAYVIPNTKTATAWVVTGVADQLAEALTDGMYGWPATITQGASSTNAAKPWTNTGTALDQPIGSQYIFEGTASVVGNTHNLHLLLHADGYGYSIADFLSSPYGSGSISNGATAGTGSFAWTGDTADKASSRVFNVALYASLAQGPQYGVMKQLLALDADRVALIFKETQAAGTLTSAQRASILTHSFNTDAVTGDKLFDMIKSNANDSDNLDIGTVIVAHLNSATGGAVPTGTDYNATTFLGAQSSVEDLARHIMDYPGQIYAAMIDVTDANQEANDIEIFAAALMRLSEDDLVKFAANAKKWNTTAGRAEADMVNYNNLQGVVIPLHAKSETLANGLVVEYEAGVSRLPVALLNKLKALL